jgi:2-dehydropantoate 2-reductase
LSAPSVNVVGAGAIGGWVASLLASQGWDVRLLARGETLAAIRARGLRVDGTRFDLPASDNPAELGPADYLVLAVKGHDLPALEASLKPLTGAPTAVVSMMNGVPWWFFEGLVGPLENAVLERVDPGGGLKRRLPVEQVIGAVVHASAHTPEPGVVRLVKADRLTFGTPEGGDTDPRIAPLWAACNAAGVATQVSPDIRREIWAKLWGNMSLNPLSALTRALTGPLLDDPETRGVCLQMMGEMAALGLTLGLDLGMTAAARMEVTRKLGSFKTSMLQDLEAGRRLELDPLLGVLVEIADRLSRPAPYLRAVYGLARQLDVSIQGVH